MARIKQTFIKLQIISNTTLKINSDVGFFLAQFFDKSRLFMRDWLALRTDTETIQ